MTVLKVSSSSVPSKVAGSMSEIIKQEGSVDVQAIGAGAVNQTVKAIAVCRGYLAPLGYDLVCIPAFAQTVIEGEDKSVIKFIVKPIR